MSTPFQILLFLLVGLAQLSFGQGREAFKTYHDGPYVFFAGDTTQFYWIKEGSLLDTFYLNDSIAPDMSSIDDAGIDYTSLIYRDIVPDHQTEYNDVDSVLALSDIHGQYDLMIQIFKENNVIDDDHNWTLGKGHLVISGDIFDRGDRVLDIVWFLIDLEKQASEAGGKVHTLIGNHEWMVLSSDVRYIHKKYRYTSALFRKQYHKLFGADSFLGQWLRSKPVYIKINGISFVHGGISEQYFQYDIPLTDINEYYYQEVLFKTERLEDDTAVFMTTEDGPLWYRGYAYKDEYDEERTEKLLDLLESKAIVVGHTSMPEIFSLHDNKIIFIDSSIKLGQGGEILYIIEGKNFYKGNEKGKVSKL